jgi:hypothetical protein
MDEPSAYNLTLHLTLRLKSTTRIQTNFLVLPPRNDFYSSLKFKCYRHNPKCEVPTSRRRRVPSPRLMYYRQKKQLHSESFSYKHKMQLNTMTCSYRNHPDERDELPLAGPARSMPLYAAVCAAARVRDLGVVGEMDCLWRGVSAGISKVRSGVKVPYLRGLFFRFSVIFDPFLPKSRFFDPDFSVFCFFSIFRYGILARRTRP